MFVCVYFVISTCSFCYYRYIYIYIYIQSFCSGILISYNLVCVYLALEIYSIPVNAS